MILEDRIPLSWDMVGCGGKDADFESKVFHSYCMYLIARADQDGNLHQYSAVISENREHPVLPDGYQVFRKVGHLWAGAESF